MNIKSLLPLTLSLLALSPLVHGADNTQACAAPAVPATFQAHENINYKNNLGMDVFLPSAPSDQPLPVALIIHGGAWIQGNRKDFNPLAQQLTSMGYAGVTVSYRLANDVTGRFPAPVEDLRCAIKTLKKMSSELNLNTDRIVSIGFSAGAHLAAELGLTADNTDFDDTSCPTRDFEPEVQGVVGYYGPYDLRKTDGLSFQQIWILFNFLGFFPEDNPAEAAFASPAAQIHDEKIPFYLVHAADDQTVPVRSSREFTAALNEKGVPNKYVETATGDHSLRLFDSRPLANEATCGSVEYLTNFVAE